MEPLISIQYSDEWKQYTNKETKRKKQRNIKIKRKRKKDRKKERKNIETSKFDLIWNSFLSFKIKCLWRRKKIVTKLFTSFQNFGKNIQNWFTQQSCWVVYTVMNELNLKFIKMIQLFETFTRFFASIFSVCILSKLKRPNFLQSSEVGCKALQKQKSLYISNFEQTLQTWRT